MNKKSQGDQKKVLLIEDEEDLVIIYKTIFEKAGYAFMAEKDIERAQVAIKTKRPDLILLDLVLPKREVGMMNLAAKQGFVFLQQLKANRATADIPVIILTNLNTIDDRQKAIELKANGYLIKSEFLPIQIIDKIREILKEKNLEF